MSSWQRARSEEQVAQRVEAILAAASRLFETIPYEEVTLRSIAREAGFTRSNIYRYFETREAIFLRLYRDDVERWVAELRAAVSAGAAVASAPEAATDLRAPGRQMAAFVDLWTEVLLRQKRLLRLTPLLALSLEGNSSEALYREFKEFTIRVMSEAAEFLGPYLPDLDRGMMLDFFLVHQALVAGAQPMCRYSDMQQRILAAPELAPLRLEFGAFYRTTVLAYLRGLAG
jgi:TetR/AcrR family transcriptional regulator